MPRTMLMVLILLLGLAFALAGGWVFWAERHPERERDLRVATQQQLEEWFPEAMSLPPDRLGFHRPAGAQRGVNPDVVLVHGLDEPGGIWDETMAALAAVGVEAWEFRYPNDQAIAHSADLLAEHWQELDQAHPIVLIGHSMGGLVIRDFVTRHRYPIAPRAGAGGPAVLGVLLVATPNHGSDWARLRAWLELREWAADLPEGRFSLFAGLRDGTGAAKVDLRPGSRFLTELNARPWPEGVPIFMIGGQLAEPSLDMLAGLDALAEQGGIGDLRQRVLAWLAETGEDLGDGAVAVESLALDGAPEPLIVPASHRGLLVTLPFAEGDPPAIEWILAHLSSWRVAE